MLDIKRFSDLDGNWMKIIDLTTGKETGGEIYVNSIDSPVYTAAVPKLAKKFAHVEEWSTELRSQRGIELYCLICTNFRGIKSGKKVLEYSPELMGDIIRNNKWITRQIDDFFNNNANFLKVEPKN